MVAKRRKKSKSMVEILLVVLPVVLLRGIAPEWFEAVTSKFFDL